METSPNHVVGNSCKLWFYFHEKDNLLTNVYKSDEEELEGDAPDGKHWVSLNGGQTG